MSTGSSLVKRNFTKTRWFLPAFSLVVGLMMFGASVIGGDSVQGIEMFGIMAAAGALFFFGGHSETIRGLRGDGRDERFAQMDLRATAFAGGVVILVILAAFLWQIARGHTGEPYSWLGAIAGVAYIAGVVFIRVRG